MRLLLFIAFVLNARADIFQDTLDRYLESVPALIAQLPDPSQPPARDNWQPMSDTCSALVNVYRKTGDKKYLDQARKIADWLIRSNDYLVAHRDPSIPYLGWGPKSREGYFSCKTVGNYHADDLWDTASVLRGILKVAEVDSNPIYLKRARQIADAWPYIEHDGMRWYRKSNEGCENRYVKNTNIAMGEQIFRIYRLTHAPEDLDGAVRTLKTQIWDVLTEHNLAYTSYMTYVDHSADYAEQVAHNEHKVIHDGDTIRCSPKDSSCWNHLGYEGYAMFNIQQLTRDLPLDAAMKDDIAKTIKITMDAWHQSKFGNTKQFDWAGKDSTTHITAYNCAMRFSSDPIYDEECRRALEHKKPSATVFYSMVPESLFAK